MFKKLAAIKQAMEVGQMLDDPIPLKNKQAMTGLAVAVIGAGLLVAEAFFGASLDVSDEQITEVGGMVAAICVSVYGLFNFVSTIATTKKVGLQDKSKSNG